MRLLLLTSSLVDKDGTNALAVADELARAGLDFAVASDTPADAEPVRTLGKLGIAHYAVPLGLRGAVFAPFAVASLRRILISRNIGLIHAFGVIPAWIAAMARRGVEPIPLVVTYRDGQLPTPPQSWPHNGDPARVVTVYESLLGGTLYPKPWAGLEEEG